MVTGRLEQRSFETKEGERRTVLELTADEVAASLKYATATVAKATRSAGTPTSAASTGVDPLGGAPEPTDEPPF